MECFLCNHTPGLDVPLMEPECQLLKMVAGLGPLMDGYFVLAHQEHKRSLADCKDIEIVTENIERIRARLLLHYDSVLLTEHGRVPVCRDEDGHEDHCFHAHMLGFPNAPEITTLAKTYFRVAEEKRSLKDAILAARDYDNYAIVSPEPGRTILFGEALNFPRQLLRTLVAHKLGDTAMGDWRTHPAKQEAISNAVRLRRLLAQNQLERE